MNNITGEYQALPEEMFSKQVLIYSVHVVGVSQDTPDIRRTNSDCFCLRPS